MNKNSTQKGFSIVEVLIAATMLTSLVVFFTYFGNRTQQKHILESDKVCRSVTEEVMNKIRGIGYEKSLINTQNLGLGNNLKGQFHPDNTRNQIEYLPASMQSALQLNGTNRTPIDDSSGVYEIESYKNIVGIMSFLGDLYNSSYSAVRNPASGLSRSAYPFANATKNLLDIDSIENNAGDRIQNVDTRLIIEPYSLISNGVDSSAPYPLRIRPLGETNTATGEFYLTAEAPSVKPDLNATGDYGYLVTVKASYTTKNGQNQSCESKSLFRYPLKRIPADLSSGITSVAFNWGTGPSPACETTLSTGGTATITTNIANTRKKGYVLLCKDTSYLASDALYPPRGSGSCSYTAPKATSIPTNPVWLPCHQSRICGQAPASYNSPNETTLNVVYTNIPLGCVASYEARLVDSALNTGVNSHPIIPTVTPNVRTCHPCLIPSTSPGWYLPENGYGNPACPPIPTPPPGPSGPGGQDGQDGDGGQDGGDGGGGSSSDGDNGH